MDKFEKVLEKGRKSGVQWIQVVESGVKWSKVAWKVADHFERR